MDVSVKEKSFSKAIRELWGYLNREQRWYTLAFVLPFGTFILCELYEFITVSAAPTKILTITFFCLPASIGILIYLSQLAHRVSSNIVLKSLFSVLLAAAVTFSLSLADGLINETLKVPSSPFTYTQTITAILLIPIFLISISMIFAVVGVFALTFFPTWGLISALSNTEQNAVKNKYPKRTTAARWFYLICMGVMSGEALSQSNNYEQYVKDFIQQYAFNFEMEKYTHCESSEGEKIAYIDSSAVVVGTKNNESYEFKVRACKESIAEGVGRKVDETTKELVRDFLNGLQ
ncbi:MAG: hypothetical protein ACRBB4_09120 [Neptuniibacter sp.]